MWHGPAPPRNRDLRYTPRHADDADVGRRHWLLVGALALFGALPQSVTADDSVVHDAAHGNLITRVRTTAKVVALSFDDGPDVRWTPAVLDDLDRYHAHATFFMEGRYVRRSPWLARQVVERGHEVANHTYDHPDLRPLDAATVRREITRADQAFAAAGLPQPTLFRPPKGYFDADAATAVASQGLLDVGWTRGLCVEARARHAATPAEGMQHLLDRVTPGAILLAHDGGIPDRSRTLKALPVLLAGLYARGYRVVTVSELLAMAR